jgi:hypothetical protein
MKSLKKILFASTAVMLGAMVLNLTGCKNDDPTTPSNPALNDQVRVQVAYDATEVAFKFTWKSQGKLYPTGSANVGQNYPMHYHDMLKYNGTKFDRLPSSARMEEDRITFMIEKQTGGIAAFKNGGCAITCHTGMASHNLGFAGTIDHWHWRGGRTGPMGYAEDAALNETERIRDNTSGALSKFLRSAGDRIREDQAAMTGTAHNVLIKGFPRFVFNKGKAMPGGYTIPTFFTTNQSGAIMTDPYTQIPQMKDVSKNISLLVAYQDLAFDNVDKVNALDLGYLVWVAYGSTDHLPAHLQDATSADFIAWKDYCATQSGITSATAAITKLDAVYQEWQSASENAMVARSIGFIYSSDQHDVYSERSYDANKNEWTVVLKRKLNTSSTNDCDLSGLPSGGVFTFSFAMHDSGAGSETHNISMPLSLSNGADSDVKAKSVSSVSNVSWGSLPYFDTNWVRQDVMDHFHYDWLTSGSHPGAGMMSTSECKTCHNKNSNNLLDAAVLQ